MSRESMLYSNPALTSIPVKVANWKKNFDEESVFRKNNGNGLIIEGCLVEKSRVLITAGLKGIDKHHFVVLHIDATYSWQRRFDTHGVEVDPAHSTSKKVSTGYLMSSYKDVKKQGVDEVPIKSLHERLESSDLSALVQEKVAGLKRLHLVSVWAHEEDLQGIDLVNGAHVRLRTRGSGPLIDSIVEVDLETAHLTSYSTGDKVGKSWTDKVMDLKEDKSVSESKREEGEAAGDDEWDD